MNKLEIITENDVQYIIYDNKKFQITMITMGLEESEDRPLLIKAWEIKER